MKIKKYKRKFNNIDELLDQKYYVSEILERFCRRHPKYTYETNVSVSKRKYILSAKVYEK